MAKVKKKIIVRWTDAAGNRVAANTPGATKTVEESEMYYAFNIPGQPRGKAFALKVTRQDQAERKLHEMLKRVERGLSPLDTRAEASKLPMAEHLKDFQEALASGATGKAGKTDAQVKQVLQRIQAVIGGCKFQSLCELDGDKVAAYLAKRRKPKSQTVGAFLSWQRRP